MLKLKIRKYRKSDSNDVKNLHITGLKQNNAYIGGDRDKDLDNIEEVYLKNGEFIVGEIANKIVAMGAFKKISDKIAEIKRIRVSPEHQRKGFGQIILGELENRAAKLGYKILQLDTTNKQMPAQKFFEKNEYVKTKTERLEKHDLDMIYYEKQLKCFKMLDFSKIKTISIRQRKNKVRLIDLVNPENSKILMDSIELNEFADIATNAAVRNKQVILMMGAHVIKVGMSLLIIDLMKKGIIKHIAMNGAGPIHDFELALIGETSEYVEQTIEDGTFGMIEETGKILNEAINEGAKNNSGYGYSIGEKINDLNLPNKEFSILYNAYKLNIPVTVHVAIGTDIIHQHPSCDGAAIGKTSYQDFRVFAESVSKLEEGVILNIGCAVILPEVFLKALTIARNLGFKVNKITAANFDMNNHYRPRENVVTRPTSLGGKGFIIIERHEKTIPTLHRLLVNGINKNKFKR